MPLMRILTKKPINWLGQAKRRATQLENLCRHCVSFVGDLASNRDRIIDCRLGPFCALFTQSASMAFCLMWWAPSVVVVHHKVSGSTISRTVWLTISYWLYRPSLQPHRLWRRQLLPVGIYRSSKRRSKMPPPTGLGRIIVAQPFSWPNQLVDFLVYAIFSCILQSTGSSLVTSYRLRQASEADLCWNRSQQILPKFFVGGIFDRVFAITFDSM